MTLFATIQFGTAMLAATEPTVARRLYEWTLPQTPLGWIVAAVALAMLLATALSISWRDTVELGPFWRTWLASLRLAVLLALAVIAMDPKQRTQKIAFRPSRAVL
ncbi:MAG: hypothetical protein GXP27_11315, partial [Planctomycetes bacterium]|nr:hypothetical protein [Planctomycetota bacterium]